jgi:hypothetical protein
MGTAPFHLWTEGSLRLQFIDLGTLPCGGHDRSSLDASLDRLSSSRAAAHIPTFYVSGPRVFVNSFQAADKSRRATCHRDLGNALRSNAPFP